MIARRKESLQTRLDKLLTKIRVRVNTALGRESKLSLEALNLGFPSYGRAISRITKIQENMVEENNVTDIKHIKIGNIVRSGITMVPAGGGHYIIKKNGKALCR